MLHNFNSGPSILPKVVYEQASQAIGEFNNTGLSILEIGHRTPAFVAVVEEAKALAKELMQLDNEHEVLFLHGGASTQFFQVPMNLLSEKGTAAYLDCGIWGTKAIKEAKLFGNVEVVGSSKDKNYTYIPKNLVIPPEAQYFHYIANNTVEGTQMHAIPETSVPLVADMSSDILSQVIDFNRFSLIYAGAQKNIEAGSLLNTPPVFAIYVCLLTLRWLKGQGGIPAIEKINDRKTALLYDTLDSQPLFRPTVAKEDRSKMNVVFVIDNPELEKEFLAVCKDNGMVGIKGYRTVGGFRASLYNALPLESVTALTDLMKDFANKKG